MPSRNSCLLKRSIVGRQHWDTFPVCQTVTDDLWDEVLSILVRASIGESVSHPAYHVSLMPYHGTDQITSDISTVGLDSDCLAKLMELVETTRREWRLVCDSCIHLMPHVYVDLGSSQYTAVVLGKYNDFHRAARACVDVISGRIMVLFGMLAHTPLLAALAEYFRFCSP